MKENQSVIKNSSNESIMLMFHDVHNIFWKKWRDQSLPKESSKWDEVMEEGGAIMRKYNCCQLVCDMVGGLIEILDQRMRRRELNGKI